ncbi:uncharacterized protein LOC144578777 isoform X11 [Callithrix jacchus]
MSVFLFLARQVLSSVLHHIPLCVSSTVPSSLLGRAGTWALSGADLMWTPLYPARTLSFSLVLRQVSSSILCVTPRGPLLPLRNCVSSTRPSTLRSERGGGANREQLPRGRKELRT